MKISGCMYGMATELEVATFMPKGSEMCATLFRIQHPHRQFRAFGLPFRWRAVVAYATLP